VKPPGAQGDPASGLDDEHPAVTDFEQQAAGGVAGAITLGCCGEQRGLR
jgi:hypothetical protein